MPGHPELPPHERVSVKSKTLEIGGVTRDESGVKVQHTYTIGRKRYLVSQIGSGPEMRAIGELIGSRDTGPHVTSPTIHTYKPFEHGEIPLDELRKLVDRIRGMDPIDN